MSFESEKSFSDFTNFPRGIRRSGRFSVKESELLEEFGTAMMEIYKGEQHSHGSLRQGIQEVPEGNQPAEDS